ncbi:hypothetical protein PGTUg99_009513 [Puccinia graminis f. sp. tritici]|uniref:Uncharacterized protein n=1 Tax=Puccinia graminis f. sp. tritici TaxID=56615 RepID=A0A5B0S2L6_PUCGR|nr:hypothetical protein PGTUg99_009513 [Puccinia graminis f. sp. tritici]
MRNLVAGISSQDRFITAFLTTKTGSLKLSSPPATFSPSPLAPPLLGRFLFSRLPPTLTVAEVHARIADV